MDKISTFIDNVECYTRFVFRNFTGQENQNLLRQLIPTECICCFAVLAHLYSQSIVLSGVPPRGSTLHLT